MRLIDWGAGLVAGALVVGQVAEVGRARAEDLSGQAPVAASGAPSSDASSGVGKWASQLIGRAASSAPPAAAVPSPAPPAATPVATPGVVDEEAAVPATPPEPATPAAEGHGKPKPKAPLIAAKVLFGAVRSPATMQARSLGFYSKGCLAGAKSVPIDGPAWQVMRLSRNRNWGHPALVRWVERFARDAQTLEGWNGLLVGDLSQPRGGPMLTGHASHQVGLDADLWLTPMPDRRLSKKEREELAATSMLPAGDEHATEVDASVWSERQVRLIRRAANYAEVERIFVHPAIKKALCHAATAVGADHAWLWKVRPMWGHHYHFHVRLACPPDDAACKPQKPTAADDGCGKELQDWLTLVARRPPPPPPVPPTVPAKPVPPKPQMTLDQLPAECRVVLGPYGRGG